MRDVPLIAGEKNLVDLLIHRRLWAIARTRCASPPLRHQTLHERRRSRGNDNGCLLQRRLKNARVGVKRQHVIGTGRPYPGVRVFSMTIDGRVVVNWPIRRICRVFVGPGELLYCCSKVLRPDRRADITDICRFTFAGNALDCYWQIKLVNSGHIVILIQRVGIERWFIGVAWKLWTDIGKREFVQLERRMFGDILLPPPP